MKKSIVVVLSILLFGSPLFTQNLLDSFTDTATEAYKKTTDSITSTIDSATETISDYQKKIEGTIQDVRDDLIERYDDIEFNYDILLDKLAGGANTVIVNQVGSTVISTMHPASIHLGTTLEASQSSNDGQKFTYRSRYRDINGPQEMVYSVKFNQKGVLSDVSVISDTGSKIPSQLLNAGKHAVVNYLSKELPYTVTDEITPQKVYGYVQIIDSTPVEYRKNFSDNRILINGRTLQSSEPNMVEAGQIRIQINGIEETFEVRKDSFLVIKPNYLIPEKPLLEDPASLTGYMPLPAEPEYLPTTEQVIDYSKEPRVTRKFNIPQFLLTSVLTTSMGVALGGGSYLVLTPESDWDNGHTAAVSVVGGILGFVASIPFSLNTETQWQYRIRTLENNIKENEKRYNQWQLQIRIASEENRRLLDEFNQKISLENMRIKALNVSRGEWIVAYE